MSRGLPTAAAIALAAIATLGGPLPSDAGVTPLPSTGQASGKAIATIAVSQSDSGIVIVGRVMALEDLDLRGEMVIDRQGSGGTMSTRQASEFALTAGASDDIARVGVSFEPGDFLEVTVVLTSGDEEIAKSMLTVGER